MARPTTRRISTRSSAQPKLSTTLKSTKSGVSKTTKTAAAKDAKPKLSEFLKQDLADSTPTPSNARVMGIVTGHIDATERPASPGATNAPLVFPPPAENVVEDVVKPTTDTGHLLQQAVDHIIKQAPSLKGLVEANHCTPFSNEGLTDAIDPFHSLASGIISQQVSGAAAKSIKAKFVALFSEQLEKDGLAFPTPVMVLGEDLATLRTAGLSGRKAEYLLSLAQAFESGNLNQDLFLHGSNEEITEHLTKIYGIGVWSAQMFLMFGLRRLDVFSTGDLGIQRGMAVYVGKNVKALKTGGKGKWKYMSEADMIKFSEPFKPYRSVFMWYMWRLSDTEVESMAATKKKGKKSED